MPSEGGAPRSVATSDPEHVGSDRIGAEAEGLDGLDPEALMLDGRDRGPVRVSAAGDPAPQGSEGILDANPAGRLTSNVLEEAQATARLEHAADLPEGLSRV